MDLTHLNIPACGGVWRCMTSKLLSAAVTAGVILGVALTVLPSAWAAPVFIPPGGSAGGFEWPTKDWARGQEGATYAEWNSFASPAGPNSPDVGFSGFEEQSAANLAETSGTAFITSTGNIYSSSGVTDYDVTVPAAGGDSVGDTFFVAQINTLGSELDFNSLKLSYDNGGQLLAPAGSFETHRLELGGFGGAEVTTVFWWEIAAASPAEFLLEFNSAGSSMSLGELMIDTYLEATSEPLLGDYDGNGIVDSGDFDLWQTQFGMSVGGGLGASGQGADGNGDGVVDALDYAIWREQLAAPPVALQVPEPTGGQMVSMVCLAAAFCGWVTWFGRSPCQRRSANEARRIEQ